MQTEAAFHHEPLALFVNTASRTGLERFEEVRAALARLGAPVVGAHAVDDPPALPEMVNDAVNAGVRRVLVGGGDGTLSAVAEVLCGRDVRMAVLPLGTCNDFARSLRIPSDVEAACRVAINGEVRAIDVGLANGRAFLNAASIGLSAAITDRLSDELKRRLGRGAFALVAAEEAWNHRPFQATLETDVGTHSMEVHQVVVGNGRYHGGGQLVAPEASHLDHRLDVYAIHSAQPLASAAHQPDQRARLQDLWTLLRVAMLLRRGRHLQHPAVTHLRATRVRLTATPIQEVDVDGELMGHTPVLFEVRPGELQVLVPPGREVA